MVVIFQFTDCHKSKLLKNRNWQIVINPNVLHHNWYLNPVNQHKYGYRNSGKKLIIFAVIVSVVVATIQITFYLLSYTHVLRSRLLVFVGIGLPALTVICAGVK